MTTGAQPGLGSRALWFVFSRRTRSRFGSQGREKPHVVCRTTSLGEEEDFLSTDGEKPHVYTSYMSFFFRYFWWDVFPSEVGGEVLCSA